MYTSFGGIYRDLRVLNDEPLAREESQRIPRMDRSDMEAHYAGSPSLGHVFLLPLPPKNAAETPVILEFIPSASGKDNITTLYAAHPVFNDRGEYARHRREVLTTIEDIMQAAPGSLHVRCRMRDRAAQLRELSFAQLLDIVEDLVRRTK